MLISVSQIKAHMRCPMKSYYRDVLRIGTGKIEDALEVGTLAHAAFAAKLGGQDWRAATEPLMVDFGLTPEGQEVVKHFDALAPALDLWTVPEDFVVQYIEKEFRIPLGRHEIVGTLDTVGEWNGWDWHLQHKTLGASKPPEIYIEQQRTDWHESVYQRMMEMAGLKPMGTCLNILRKLSAKTIAADPAKALVPIVYLPRSDDEVDAALADLEQIVNDIEDGIEGRRRIVKNRSMCAGPFDNSLCVYKDVCDGHIGLDDPMFVQIEERYGSLGDSNDSAVV